MRSTALEVIFKKNKTFWKNIFPKKYIELDKNAHKSEKSENSLSHIWDEPRFFAGRHGSQTPPSSLWTSRGRFAVGRGG